MAVEIKFANEKTYQTIEREKLMAFVNVAVTENDGTVSVNVEAPDFAPLGIGVESGSQSYDWQRESKKDIWGNTYNSMKKPIVTKELQPWPVSGNDKAQKHIWKLGVVDQDNVRLAAQDILIVHAYVTVGDAADVYFAERYDASSIEVTDIGGDGGGILTDGCNVTYGGARTVGRATIDKTGKVTFAAGLEDAE